jgi:hypothetical protein
VKEVIFVCDLFTEHYLGGAELTTKAIMAKSNKKNTKVLSKDITPFFIKKNKNKKWIFGNFAQISNKLRLDISKKVSNYSIIEYDYKICAHRSLELHKEITGLECDCENTLNGKINQVFYCRAKAVWFMSEEQKQIFLKRIKPLKLEKCFVLSSVFEESHLKKMIDSSKTEKNEKFAIINSPSWIKGVKDSIDYAIKNNLEYELLQDLKYDEMLTTLSRYKGLIFLPRGKDTCPRLVIESFIMGLECILNENVQHKNEEWFKNRESCITYLKQNADKFWEFYE